MSETATSSTQAQRYQRGPGLRAPKGLKVPPPVARTAQRVQRAPESLQITAPDWDLARVMLVANQTVHREDGGAPLRGESGPPLWCVYTEAAALGALMLHPLNRLSERWAEQAQHHEVYRHATQVGFARLRPELFRGDQNRQTFEAMRALWQRRHADESATLFLEPATVGTQMRRMGCWNDAYSAAYLMALLEACATPANIAHYCDELERLWKLRQMRALAHHLVGNVDATREPNELAALCRTMLDTIEAGRTPDWQAWTDQPWKDVKPR